MAYEMFEIVNEFMVFTLALFGMLLAYLSKSDKDK